MRIFALKFIRKILCVDLLHFVPAKKDYIFKMGQTVGPFVISTRQAFNIVEAMLKAMEFEKGKIWHYNPRGIITRTREKIKASTYVYDPKPEVEWEGKFDSWPLNIDMETESLVNMDKTQKRAAHTSWTTDMEEGLVHKKYRSQGQEQE